MNPRKAFPPVCPIPYSPVTLIPHLDEEQKNFK